MTLAKVKNLADALQITPEQLRQARALLGWSRVRLAARSKTTIGFVTQFEKSGRIAAFFRKPKDFDGLAALCAILEAVGAEFTNGDQQGVRLVKVAD